MALLAWQQRVVISVFSSLQCRGRGSSRKQPTSIARRGGAGDWRRNLESRKSEKCVGPAEIYLRFNKQHYICIYIYSFCHGPSVDFVPPTCCTWEKCFAHILRRDHVCSEQATKHGPGRDVRQPFMVVKFNRPWMPPE